MKRRDRLLRGASGVALVIVVIRVIVTLLLAVLANFALDESSALGQGHHLWDDKYDRPTDLFVLGTAVLWLVILLIQALVGSIAVTIAVTLTLTGLVALANYKKMLLRGEPVYPSDLRFAGDPGFLKDMVGPGVVVEILVGLFVTVALCAGLVWLSRRLMPNVQKSQDRRVWQWMVAGRLTTALACALVLVHVAHFNTPGNEARRLYDNAGAFWSEWNQKVNYSLNGFVGGVLYNTPVPAMTPPPGYGAAEMRRLTAKYAAAADRINHDRTAGALDDVNVVAVLSETLTDPRHIKGVRLAEDPIPFTRSLMASTTSGQMLAQGIGGGTANMEFELLTGMSMHEFAPQLTTAYQSLVPHYHEFPSAVGYFEAHGHATIAIHPFDPGMYRRDEVYRTFGFDDFIDRSRMSFREKIDHSPVISDDSAFWETTQQIDRHAKPLLVNLVTMQNHMPYTGLYDDPVKVKEPAHSGSLGQYVRGLTHTDDALRSFIGRLQKSDEKTVVVMYGDHLPSAYPHSLYDQNGVRRIHETPFFVWSNFPTTDVDQPTTSPWAFMDLVFQQADAPVPPYYALLDQLHKEVPAMDGEVVVDGQDRTVGAGDLSGRARSLLRDYRMVQYDLSVGKRYSLGKMFYSPRKSAPVASR